MVTHSLSDLSTVIRFIFVVKIFSYAKNARKYFTRIYFYIENFSNEYLELHLYVHVYRR